VRRPHPARHAHERLGVCRLAAQHGLGVAGREAAGIEPKGDVHLVAGGRGVAQGGQGDSQAAVALADVPVEGVLEGLLGRA
jgi:hypothetical protein